MWLYSPKLLPAGVLDEFKLKYMSVSTHHQEHLTVFTLSGSILPVCCRLVSWMIWNWSKCQFQLIIRSTWVYLHYLVVFSQFAAGWFLGRVETEEMSVSTHHQEHFTVFTVSVSIHPSCCRLVSWISWNWSICQFQLIIRSTWLYLQYLVLFTQVAAGWCLGWVETEVYVSFKS